MNDNRFMTAGWASIAAAALMPLGFVVAGIEMEACSSDYTSFPVGIGVADFVFLIYCALSIYVLLSLKKLMYERYSFRGLHTIIGIAILWNIVNYCGSFLLQLFISLGALGRSVSAEFIPLVFWIVCIAVFGIIDIVFGVILLRQLKRFSTPIKVLAFVSLASGVFEAAVILSFLALLLVPIAYVALAFEFLRKNEAVEFV